MKKTIAVLCGFAAATAIICAVPDAAVNAAPSATVISPKVVSYSESLTENAVMSYIGQSDVTCTLPLVIDQYVINEGDYICAGDVIATVNRQASQSMISSLGQISGIPIAAADLSTAMQLIPQEIIADRTGTVICTAGNGVAIEAGSSICTIAGTDTLVLNCPVSEQYLSRIQLGQNVTFSLTAYPDELFTGKVAYISAAARSQYSGSVLETVVDVTIAPDSYDPRMKSGLTAEAVFTLTTPKNICVLSYDAIGQDEGGEYVYIYQDGKAIRRKIFTGAEFPDGAEIIKGVSNNELVFVSPESIRENTYIKID